MLECEAHLSFFNIAQNALFVSICFAKSGEMGHSLSDFISETRADQLSARIVPEIYLFYDHFYIYINFHGGREH